MKQNLLYTLKREEERLNIAILLQYKKYYANYVLERKTKTQRIDRMRDR